MAPMAYFIWRHNEGMKPKQPIVPFCNCERCDERRMRRKRRKYLRARGRPRLVYPHEAAQAIRKLQSYHDDGMTRWDMAEASGGKLNSGSFADWVNQVNKTMSRDSYDAVMAMPFLRATPLGSRVPMEGSMRRICALRAAGWPCKTALAGFLGIKGSTTSLYKLSAGQSNYVFHSTYLKIKAVYEKYIDVDPIEWGVPEVDVRRAKIWAKRAECAPAHCWDDDTIDDPEAIAEWTGVCGTPHGYRIHLREKILPACAECKTAHAIYRKFPGLCDLMGIVSLGGKGKHTTHVYNSRLYNTRLEKEV